MQRGYRLSWRKWGMLPQASVSPADLRATRARRWRRRSLPRKRAELRAHLPHTTRQDHLPESGNKLADTAHRAGVAERCPALAVHQRLAGDLALRGPEDPRRRERAWPLVPAARPPDPNTRSRLQTVPGSGPRLRLSRRYERHDLPRFPRVPACVASWRRGTGAKASAGTRDGTAGAKRGQASRTWACSEAAVRLRRDQPAGQKALPRRENTQGPGTALTRRAPQRGRAVEDR